VVLTTTTFVAVSIFFTLPSTALTTSCAINPSEQVNANKTNIRNFAIVVSPIFGKTSRFRLGVDKAVDRVAEPTGSRTQTRTLGDRGMRQYMPASWKYDRKTADHRTACE